MDTKIKVIEYEQNGLAYLACVLKLDVLDRIADVLIYGNDPNGYQRKPNKVHYNGIKNYILRNEQSFVLPTSIILGGDKKHIAPRIERKGGESFLVLETETKMFRIVDGQHRISGLNEAAKESPAIKEFLLNVIIVLTDDNRRSVELELFTDINSKAKRINTDLAELAKYDYQILEKRINADEVNRHIGIKTAYYLKEHNDLNVWQNAIRFDIHAEVNIGIVGITIFTDSMKQIIDRYIIDNPYKSGNYILEGKDLIAYCQMASEIIGLFIYRVWNEVIKVKWGSTFKEDIIKNDEGHLVKIFYSKDYYIQKGIGVKSLNPIIGNIVHDHGINDIAFKIIKDLIFNSRVKIDDWINGGPFSGFNSESGFSKIKGMILNQQILEK